ncbi:beta-glucan synthesis-associated [Mycena alexandri]|uniref:Beta-glucan synthesis-associated n=1 Tax=Mycena alexandri TaxID=1745969 RepID=A0AAD6T7D6_9AGAR|nr:beta-glucan synthesis-associated [Mycena alexandri]
MDRPSTSKMSRRGFANIGCLILLSLGLLGLFLGYPVATFVNRSILAAKASCAAPAPPPARVDIKAVFSPPDQLPAFVHVGLIDADTPVEAHTITSWSTGKEMKLVFSDEFETDNRTVVLSRG